MQGGEAGHRKRGCPKSIKHSVILILLQNLFDEKVDTELIRQPRAEAEAKAEPGT